MKRLEGVFKTKSEEEESYPKQPKTDMKASQLFDRAWKKKQVRYSRGYCDCVTQYPLLFCATKETKY